MTKHSVKTLPHPPFTIQDLRAAIPAHLFKRSALKSLAYLARDFALAGALFWLSSFIALAPLWARCVLWPLYWWAQGIIVTGIWVIAHECGHQAFSDSQTLNYTLGLVLHSALLVPFHSWRISHAKHHKSTNDMDNDQVFVPTTYSELSTLEHAMKDAPLWPLIVAVRMALIGWPMYLFFDATSSSRFHNKKGVSYNHWLPSSPLFKPQHYGYILASTSGVLLALAVLVWIAVETSVWAVFAHYVMPYLWVNYWLLSVTFLQHTHRDVPHYRGDEWSFVRGALATVDRNYGFIGDFFHHNIGTSHVAHHLFSTMPHYNAIQATPYLRKTLGEYYNYDATSPTLALLRTLRECYCVDDTGKVLYFVSAAQTPAPPRQQ